MSDLTVHPLAERFPELPEKDFEELKESIRKYGLFEPIIVNEKGQILDGRHRYKAIIELRKNPFSCIESFEGTVRGDKVLTEAQFIFDRNIHRRHLTQTQIAAIYLEFLPAFEEEKERVRLANLKQNSDRATVAPSVAKGKSTDLAGKQAGVSGRLIRRVKAIKERDPERFEEVRTGKIQVRDVERVFKREDYDEGVRKRNQATEKTPPPLPVYRPPAPPPTPEEIEEQDREMILAHFSEWVGHSCFETDIAREKVLRFIFEYLSAELTTEVDT